MKEEFREEAMALKLPQFFIYKNKAFYSEEEWSPLEESDLIDKSFKLEREDCKIDFKSLPASVAEVDVKGNNDTEYRLIDSKNNTFSEILSKKPSKDKDGTSLLEITKYINNKFNLIAEDDISVYVSRIIGDMSVETRADMHNNLFDYANKIKLKIRSLMDRYQKKQFKKLLSLKDKIKVLPYYKFQEEIHPTGKLLSLSKSLYEKEGSVNDFEQEVISKVATLSNVKWWHRNIDRVEFAINGYVNAYPDFIIYTDRNHIIALETKGDYIVEGTDSLDKVDNGNTWASMAGDNYHYFMVAKNGDTRNEEAISVDDFLERLALL